MINLVSDGHVFNKLMNSLREAKQENFNIFIFFLTGSNLGATENDSKLQILRSGVAPGLFSLLLYIDGML